MLLVLRGHWVTGACHYRSKLDLQASVYDILPPWRNGAGKRGLERETSSVQFSSVQFSSVQFKMVSVRLEKAYMRSTPSLKSFPNLAFATVPVFVWLSMALSRPFKEDRLGLPLSSPLSSRRSMVWCPLLCARRQCLKLLNTPDDLPRSELWRFGTDKAVVMLCQIGFEFSTSRALHCW